MAYLRTPDDLGHLIRQRRKALGWDQAKLAHEVGVSRRWVIEIEKGKSGAALSLILRTLNVLGLRLEALPADAPAARQGAAMPSGLAVLDIDQVIDHNRLDPPSAVMRETSPVYSPDAEGKASGKDPIADLVGGWLARTQPTKPPNKPT